jgi:membrane protein YdbS with pleckstrin-like domain
MLARPVRARPALGKHGAKAAQSAGGNQHDARREGGRAMAYYHKVLTADESVKAIGHLHWIIFIHAILFLIAAIVVFVLGQTYVMDPSTRQAVSILALILFALAVLAWFGGFLRRLGTEIVVTDKRVIYKRGFISRRTVEMNTSKIETVDVIQSLWGRIFGYGTLLIRGTGSGFEPLRHIGAPLTLRNAIVVG